MTKSDRANGHAPREPEPQEYNQRGDDRRPDTIKTQIKLMIFKDPTIPSNRIIEALSKRNVAPSKFTVEGIRADTRHTLKLLSERGMLSKVKI